MASFGFSIPGVNLNLDPTQMAQQLLQLEAQAKQLASQAEYWKNEAERRINEVAAGIRDPGSLIEWVKFNSTITPPVSVNEPLMPKPSDPSGKPDPFDQLVRFVKPQLLVKFKGIDRAVEIQPWGRPGPSNFETYKWQAIIGGSVVAVLALRGLVAFAWK